MSKIVSQSKGKQLYEILKKDILDGKYAKDEKLPSIRELAQIYGLSKNTVNTVIAILENDGLVYVSEGNGTFIGSRKKESRLIGVMLLDFYKGVAIDLDILKHIQLNLPANYCLTLMNSVDSYETFCNGLAQMLDMHVAGFIIIPPRGEPQPQELARAHKLLEGQHVVMVNRALAGFAADLYSMDLGKGIEKAFEYFITAGKKKCAIILHDTVKFADEERAVYEKYMADKGLCLKKEWMIPMTEDIFALKEKLSSIIGEIDSLIGPDWLLTQLNDVIKASGKAIAKELSIVGINDTVWARTFSPPLTSIVFPVEKIGRHAIAKLIKRLEGGTSEAFKTVNYEPDFVIRNT